MSTLQLELSTRLFELASQIRVRPAHRQRDIQWKRELLKQGRNLQAGIHPAETLIRLNNLALDAQRRLDLINRRRLV